MSASNHRSTSMKGMSPRPRSTFEKRMGPKSKSILDRIDRLVDKYKISTLESIGKGEKRWFSDELKTEVTDIYFSTFDPEVRQHLMLTIQVPQSNIARWKRIQERRGNQTNTTIKKHTTIIKTNSMPKAKLIGKTLKEILNETRDSKDILKQTELFTALKDTGFDNDLVVKEVSTLPSQEEFEKIMSAVALLAEQYKIERKEDERV